MKRRSLPVLGIVVSFLSTGAYAQPSSPRAAALAPISHPATISDLLAEVDLLKAAIQQGDFDAATRHHASVTYGLVNLRKSPAEQLTAEEAAANGVTGPNRLYTLPDLAKSAYKAGDLDKASRYATVTLAEANAASRHDTTGNYGGAIHDGNMVAGLVALDRGDLQSAKASLLASAQTPGSVSLRTFGPDMLLAKKLASVGETATVVQYLEACQKFWKMDNGKLNIWIATLRGGAVPDFSPNALR